MCVCTLRSMWKCSVVVVQCPKIKCGTKDTSHFTNKRCVGDVAAALSQTSGS